MNKPLGRTIGNLLEVQEAIASLNNQGPEDLKELAVTLAALTLVATKEQLTLQEAKNEVLKVFASLKPLSIFYDFVNAQGGDVNYIKNINNMKKAKFIIPIKISTSGYLVFNDNYLLGELSVLLGVGKLVKEDIIDPTAGIVLKATHGDKVAKNQVIFELHTNKPKIKHQEFQMLANKIFSISKEKPQIEPLIFKIIM